MSAPKCRPNQSHFPPPGLSAQSPAWHIMPSPQSASLVQTPGALHRPSEHSMPRSQSLDSLQDVSFLTAAAPPCSASHAGVPTISSGQYVEATHLSGGGSPGSDGGGCVDFSTTLKTSGRSREPSRSSGLSRSSLASMYMPQVPGCPSSVHGISPNHSSPLCFRSTRVQL